MKRPTFAVILLLVAAISAATGWWIRDWGWLTRLGDASRSGQASTEGVQVRALGRIEPAGGVIDLRAAMGDCVSSVSVEEGQEVAKGQELARLDSYALRQLEVESLEKQREEARQRGEAEIEMADKRIQAAKAAVENARLNQLNVEAEEQKMAVLVQSEAVAQKDRKRLDGLRQGNLRADGSRREKDLVSEQELEHQDLAVQKASGERLAAELALRKARRTSELSVTAAEADLAAAESAREVAVRSIPGKSLEKKLELAEAQRDRSILSAPTKGTILAILARAGDCVGQSPILQMANLDRMVVAAEVYEADVKRIRPGQAVTVESRSFPSPYDEKGLRGTVKHLGKIVSRPRLRELDPLAPVDRRTLEVRIELDQESSKVAAGFVHMQVDVIFPIRAP